MLKARLSMFDGTTVDDIPLENGSPAPQVLMLGSRAFTLSIIPNGGQPAIYTEQTFRILPSPGD